jgi:hypothetical protein
MEDTLRILVALGLSLLLVLLRLDAGRFGAAEYDEPVRGHRQPLLRRLSWYVLGVGGVLAIAFIHPTSAADLGLTLGDRGSAIAVGLLLGLAGVGQAVGMAMYRYRHLRLPEVGLYPSALANEVLTAFIDEATFRGALFGFMLWAGAEPNLALLAQAFAYTLATRLGAPGRDPYMFVLSLAVGLLGGWATLLTGGIGASFLGHAITRVAVFLTTGHTGQLPARGNEVEDVERRRRTPEGWRLVERDGLGGSPDR